jgi:integrase
MSNFVTTKSAGGGLYGFDGRRKYLNRDERRRFIGVMADLEPARGLFGLTLAWSGARVSEVLALRRTSFQVERGIVAFVTLKRRRHVVREVPLPPTLMLALDAEFGLTAAGELSDARLWSWRRETAWRIVKDTMIRAGIDGRCACPKGLRHAFGVGALQSGVPLNLLQRWLGHARISTTAIYLDASGPEERGFARLFWDADL